MIKPVREMFKLFLLCPYSFITKSSQSSLQMVSLIVAPQITSYYFCNILPQHEIIIMSLMASCKGSIVVTCSVSPLRQNPNSVFFSFPYSGQKNENNPIPRSPLSPCLTCVSQDLTNPLFNFTLIIATHIHTFIFAHKIPFCIPLGIITAHSTDWS